MFNSHGNSRTLEYNLTLIIIIANICIYVRMAAVKLETKMKKWNIDGKRSLQTHLWKCSAVQII